MRLVLLGPPGAGKGTQAERLAARRGVAALSTGEMLRAAVSEGSSLGKRAKAVIERGELVSDDVMIAIVAERIRQPDCVDGFILDGFPRTVAQARALDAMLQENGVRLDCVVEISVDEDFLIGRIETRAKETGGARADDNVETLKKRMAVYRQQTAPVSDYYRHNKMLITVDGVGSKDEVTAAIETAIGAVARV